jgi:hypothetical protein
VIEISDKQKEIIRKLDHKLYTVEFLEEWLNRKENVFVNAPAALQAMGADGFFAAVEMIEKLEVI